ncbi:MAG: hypothetical protein WA364_24020 [Candidatus Nitrosopolaris sp.]
MGEIHHSLVLAGVSITKSQGSYDNTCLRLSYIQPILEHVRGGLVSIERDERVMSTTNTSAQKEPLSQFKAIWFTLLTQETY